MALLHIGLQLLQLVVRELVEVELKLLLISLVVLGLVVLYNRENASQLLVVQSTDLLDESVSISIEGRHFLLLLYVKILPFVILG